jgi:hypothetical protein
VQSIESLRSPASLVKFWISLAKLRGQIAPGVRSLGRASAVCRLGAGGNLSGLGVRISRRIAGDPASDVAVAERVGPSLGPRAPSSGLRVPGTRSGCAVVRLSLSRGDTPSPAIRRPQGRSHGRSGGGALDLHRNVEGVEARLASDEAGPLEPGDSNPHVVRKRTKSIGLRT